MDINQISYQSYPRAPICIIYNMLRKLVDNI